MRILKVKGQNLTSLASFELDFECEELTQAGVFAITGPTGSGKSTLLDAICLALYGRTPRYGKKRGYDVGRDDLEKDLKLNSNDPKNLLRHGASHGFSEVEFIGYDGQKYKARWEVKRAYNRATGKIQPETYTLIQITEHGEKNLASDSRNESKKIIEEKVGLNYEQFCRSVFLAQNEFDAFLKADKLDRGILLQRMTGTEKFSLISQRVWQDFSNAKKELDELQQRLSAHSILGIQEYENTKNHVEMLKQEVLRQKEIVKHISQLQALYEHKNKYELNSKKIYAQIQHALQNREQREQRKKELLQIEDRVKLQRIYEQIKALSQKQISIDQEKELEQQSLQQLIAQEQALSLKLNQSFTDLQSQETEYEKLAPKKQMLILAEQAIQQLTQAIERLTQDQQSSKQEQQEHQKQYQKSQQQRTEYQQNLLALDQWLKEHHKLELLFHQKSRIDELLSALKTQLNQEQQLFNQEARIEQELQRLTAQAQKLVPKLNLLAEEKNQRQQAVDALSLEVAIDPNQINDQIKLKQHQLQQIEGAQKQQALTIQSLNAIVKNLEQLDQNLNEIQEFKLKMTTLEQQKHKLEGKLELITEEIKRIYEQEELSQYREQLKDGEPCPLCGALDHPGLQKPSEDIQRLNQRKSLVLQEFQGISHEAQKHQAFIQKLGSQNEMLWHNIQQNIQQNTAVKLNLLEQANPIHECWQWLLNPELPNHIHFIKQGHRLDQILVLDFQKQAQSIQALNDQQQQYLQTLEEEGQRINALQAQRDAIYRQQQQYYTATQALQQKAQEYEQVKAQVDHDQKNIRDAENQKKLSQANRAQSKAISQQLNAELHAYLNELGLQELNDEDQLQELENHINTQINEWKFNKKLLEDKKLAQQANESEYQALSLKQKQYDATIAHFQMRIEEANQELNVKQQELLALQDSRQELEQKYQAKEALKHQYHQCNQDLNQQLQRVNEQRLILQEKQAQAIQIQGNIDIQQSYLEDGMNRLNINVQALENMTFSQHMTVEELNLELKQLEAEERLSIDGEKQRDENILLYKSYLRQIHEYIDQGALWDLMTEENDFEINLDQLTLEEQDEAILNDRNQKWIAFLEQKQEQLKLNELQLINESVKLQKHEEKQNEHQNWIKLEQVLAKKVDYLHKLNQAIGSKDGSKFNNFVQSMSLEIVLDVANLHLSELAPRYELMRVPSEELELQLIDIDLGREVRSINGLSGGERFLVSLALALALSTVSANEVKIESLFIDEGFGTLDPDTLEIALNVLENLQATGRQIGIISHVEGISQRLGAEVRVSPKGAGRSEVSVHFMN